MDIETRILLLLAGMAIGAGLACWIVWIGFTRALRRRALSPRALHQDESGTAVVEFPFAIVGVLFLTVMVWQFGMLCTAYLVVDHAAFAAARSASVVVGEDWGGEGPNQLHGNDLSTGKGAKIREAAAFALAPISPDVGTPSGQGLAWATAVQLAFQTYDHPGSPSEVLPMQELARRLSYADRNTEASLVGGGTLQGGHPLTVRVAHQFRLQIPFARRLLGTEGADGHYHSEIVAHATMVNEGFTPERRPPGAPGSAGP